VATGKRRIKSADAKCGCVGERWMCGRDVTNFEFAFNDVRILAIFQLFDVCGIVWRVSVE